MVTDFPSDWKLMPIEDCMAVIIDYRGKSPRKTPSGIPLITAKIVKGGRILPPDEYVPSEDYEDWMRRGIPEAGDVVVTTEAPLGEVAQLDGRKVALAQRLIALRGIPGILNNTYLKFAMQSEFAQAQLRARSTGTTVLGVRQSELRKVRLPIPPLTEQEAIAHILGTLDEKIDLNRRMNDTLEAMARTIFKSWFVDFDPVRAKAEGRQPAGMDATAAALFPDSFEESPLGKIPIGWKATAIPDVVEINPSRYLAKGQIAPYLDMQNMPSRGHRPAVWISRPLGSGTKFTNGDTLLARITPCLENGKTAFVDFLEDGKVGWGSTEFIVLRPKPPLPIEFGYYLARSEDLRTYAIQNMTGSSGRQRVPVECFAQYFIAVPSAPLAQRFGESARQLMAMIRVNDEQSRTLAALQDALLPRLLSGELRVLMT